ncbi:hypothetical protein F4808DRAFT_469611 [Astrocystis sublimbata]|nr:hypothetical protein F4808DRAFT_469611 [Astrocystis sublimbata]
MVVEKIIPPRPGQPLSPWAQRHGFTTNSNDAAFHRGPLRHSGTGTDLRPTFWSDQITTTDGYEPWQLGVAINSLISADGKEIPGGHQKAYPSAYDGDPATHPGWERKRLYDSNLAKVNEANWLPFLSKDKWLDWHSGTPILQNGTWSVDNPRVWHELSFILEMVNKVFRALINDNHDFLKTILFGILGTWQDIGMELSLNFPIAPPDPDALVLVSYNECEKYRHSCTPAILTHMNKILSYAPGDLQAELEAILQFQRWAILDYECAFAMTHPGHGNLITINAAVLGRLVKNDVTLSERCILQWRLITTIMHELG